MTLRVGSRDGPSQVVDRGTVLAVGRDPSCEVRVGDVPVADRWTVSRVHAQLRWDGTRWSTSNQSDKSGLLVVYEPGYEEVLVEPGREWVPVRHRWCLGVGHPEHRFWVVCETDDHTGPAIAPRRERPAQRPEPQETEDATAAIGDIVALSFTALEAEVLRAHYRGFAEIPRPEPLEPRTHDQVAHELGRSRDSTRKAIERANEKISHAHDAPAAAVGRALSPEIGRWLARAGVLDPEVDRGASDLS